MNAPLLPFRRSAAVRCDSARSATQPWVGGALLLVSVLWPSEVQAHRSGYPVFGCDGCHSEAGFDGEILLEPAGDLQPGEPMTFTLTIRESHMVAAGFYVHVADEVGALGVVGGTDTALISDFSLVQSRPHSAVSGSVSVDFTWTPPSEARGTDLEVFVVAANDDRTFGGDRASRARFPFTWGCDPITVYHDIDGDGFGVDTETRQDCAARQEWADVAGDCNDAWASIHPGAMEIGNAKDDDCDGEVDEGVDTTAVYPDRDGDGFGDVLADPVARSVAGDGYVPNSADCDDDDPSVHPDAEEICDGVDNDCDYVSDEGTFQYCGVGTCSRRIESCENECVPGEPLPEICNGLDDDCNGVADDGAECPAGQICELGCRPVEEVLGEDVAAPPSDLERGSPSTVPVAATDTPASSMPATSNDGAGAAGGDVGTAEVSSNTEPVLMDLEPAAAPSDEHARTPTCAIGLPTTNEAGESALWSLSFALGLGVCRKWLLGVSRLG